MHQPKETHWLAAIRVLAYSRVIPGRKHRHVRISGYADSGYAGDREDRKSTAEYYTFVGGNLGAKNKMLFSLECRS